MKTTYFLISNMYPTQKSPGYGSFIKNVCDGFYNYGLIEKYAALIRGRDENKGKKILNYIVFYLKIIFFFFKKYDFIFLHFPNYAVPILNILYKIRKKQTVINFHGEDLLYSSSRLGMMLGHMTEEFCREYADIVVVPSDYYKEIVLERKLIEESKVIVSPSGGIDLNIFYPSREIKKKELNIGYVGRLEKSKGIIEFLEVCKVLSTISEIKYKSTIIGYGTLQPYVLSFIRENNLYSSIKYVPGVSQKDLGNYYRTMDILLFLSYQESLGLSGIEAMACGVPVIGSNVGGIKSYLNHGINGYLVSVGDIQQIIKYIYKFSSLNEKERLKICKNALETGMQYERENVCEKLANDIMLNLNIPN